MIIKKLEQTIEAAKKYQTEAMILIMQKEQSLRSNVHTAIDEGLNILGKGVVWGRKFRESFTAQTHRRAEKLKKIEATFDSGLFNEADVLTSEALATDIFAEDELQNSTQPNFHKKQMKKANRKAVAKKTKMRERRLRAHSNGSARAH